MSQMDDIWCYAATIFSTFAEFGWAKGRSVADMLEKDGPKSLTEAKMRVLIPASLLRLLSDCFVPCSGTALGSAPIVMGSIVGEIGELASLSEVDLQPGLDSRRCNVIHNNLGLSLHGQDYRKEAREQFKRATEVDSNDARAKNNLGVLLQTEGRLDNAKQLYKEALNLEPTHAQAQHNYGQLSIKSNLQRDASAGVLDYSGASTAFEKQGEIALKDALCYASGVMICVGDELCEVVGFSQSAHILRILRNNEEHVVDELLSKNHRLQAKDGGYVDVRINYSAFVLGWDASGHHENELSEYNTLFTDSKGNGRSVRSKDILEPKSGVHRFELNISRAVSSSPCMIGVLAASVPEQKLFERNGVYDSKLWWGLVDDGSLVAGSEGCKRKIGQGGVLFTGDDRVGMVIDMNNGTIVFSRNDVPIKGAVVNSLPAYEQLHIFGCFKAGPANPHSTLKLCRPAPCHESTSTENYGWKYGTASIISSLGLPINDHNGNIVCCGNDIAVQMGRLGAKSAGVMANRAQQYAHIAQQHRSQQEKVQWLPRRTEEEDQRVAELQV
jgi:hypothetical protein